MSSPAQSTDSVGVANGFRFGNNVAHDFSTLAPLGLRTACVRVFPDCGSTGFEPSLLSWSGALDLCGPCAVLSESTSREVRCRIAGCRDLEFLFPFLVGKAFSQFGIMSVNLNSWPTGQCIDRLVLCNPRKLAGGPLDRMVLLVRLRRNPFASLGASTLTGIIMRLARVPILRRSPCMRTRQGVACVGAASLLSAGRQAPGRGGKAAMRGTKTGVWFYAETYGFA